MQTSSICNNLKIVPGCLNDYKRLAHFHYRDSRPGPVAAIFTFRGCVRSSTGIQPVEDDKLQGQACPERSRGDGPVAHGQSAKGGHATTNRLLPHALRSDGTFDDIRPETPVGVIVYSMASPVLEMRNVATDHFFAGLDCGTQLALVNQNVRRISRVIIEPRFRGLGLASRLVRETMPLMNVPIIEAIAVMGWVHPFLEKAGMTAYPAKQPARAVQLIEAFSFLGIETEHLIEPQQVQHRLDQLAPAETVFIERAIKRFLKSHGRRRDMLPGLERTRYILSRLTVRPTYYIWFNPEKAWTG